MEETTDFGFKEVPTNEKKDLVSKVFSSVASNYDIMNDLMSFGIHRIWKQIAISHCAVRPLDQILDLAGGTGDLSRRIKEISNDVSITLSDINIDMLKEGRNRLLDCGYADIKFVQGDAEFLPFSDNTFNTVVIGFGLRNVTNKSRALNEMYRVLIPGGRLIVLEFSKPTSESFAKIVEAYNFNVLPLLGKFIANDAESYQYLAESIVKHPCQEDLKNLMQQSGFDDCSFHNLSFGICAIHKGFKYDL